MILPPQDHTDNFGSVVREVLQSWRAGGAAAQERMAGGAGLSILFRGAEIIVFAGNGEAGRIPLLQRDAPGALSRELARLCGGKSREVAIQIPRQEVLRPSLRMPRASRRILRKALQYELGRLSPLDPTQLYFDFDITCLQQQGLDVELRIVQRTTVDRALEICHAAGLQVAAIFFQDDPRAADWRSFPVDKPAFFRDQWRRWSTALLAGLALLLLIALVFVAYDRISYSAKQLDTELNIERGQAADVERKEHEILALATQNRFLSQQKQAPLLVSLLADISQLLPDNSWLTEIEVAGNTIRIRGYSTSASDLIALIDNSRRFRNAEFAAPVVQDGPRKEERFDLTFEVRR